MALKQQQQLGQRIPTASEESVLSSFFDFLRAGANKAGGQLVIVANSLDLLPLLHEKASSHDLAMIAGLAYVVL
jgi:hypothetical protein